MDEHASQAGVERLFSPQSVAVVGASEASLGSYVFQNLHRDFPGRLYPVNPKRAEVHGVKAYRGVDDLPEAVDMVVILTPAVTVPGIIEASAKRGIGGAVVLAAGFAEAGAEGKAAQQRMTDVARAHAFPIVGPNCNGFYNGQRQVAATFAIPTDMDRPKLGPVAVVSQSGNVAVNALCPGPIQTPLLEELLASLRVAAAEVCCSTRQKLCAQIITASASAMVFIT